MDDNLSRFCCLNPDCPLHGRRDAGNLSVRGRYGKQRHIRLLHCKACDSRFSERKGTPLFRSHLTKEKASAVFEHLKEGCGVRQTERLVGVNKDTVVRLALVAGQQAQQLHDERVAFSPSDPRSAVR